MNPRIAELASEPRGSKWRSRLIPYDEDIRRMRRQQVSYNAIAAWISDHGLVITGSAVHAYVRARARRQRDLYRLPCPSVEHPPVQISAHVAHTLEHESGLDARPIPAPPPKSTCPKKFIFSPDIQVENHFNDETLAFRDPLDPSHEYE